MLFTEQEPFVHSGVQSANSAWNKAGTRFGTKLWQRSHVIGWKSTSSNTRRRLRRVLERNRDLSPATHERSFRSYLEPRRDRLSRQLTGLSVHRIDLVQRDT